MKGGGLQNPVNVDSESPVNVRYSQRYNYTSTSVMSRKIVKTNVQIF